MTNIRCPTAVGHTPQQGVLAVANLPKKSYSLYIGLMAQMCQQLKANNLRKILV